MNLGIVAFGAVLGLQSPPVVLDDDGGWCWFQDERAVVHEGKLVVGSVSSGHRDPSRKGDVTAWVYDRTAGGVHRVELHDRLWLDDHNAPAFLVLPDGRVLAVWAKHGLEGRFYYRISEPGDPTRWGSVFSFEPGTGSRLTYQNLVQLSAEKGRIYNFFRGLYGKSKPSYAFSDDGGRTWQTGGIVLSSPAQRPYVRYVSDGRDTIHLLYTEGHPRDFDNSIYHVVYRRGRLHASDGSPRAPLNEGLSHPEQGTRVFQGGPQHVAWPVDVELDAEGRPCAVYSVQRDSAGLPPGRGGHDCRYRYARWDGGRWIDVPLAYAGTRLYPGEDDYTGLAAIDPDDVRVVYISTNADPATGTPLRSASDGRRHYEIFRGTTGDGGTTWTWTPVTRDSTADNLRPIVPRNDGPGTLLLWLRGRYTTYVDYQQEVVLASFPPDR